MTDAKSAGEHRVDIDSLLDEFYQSPVDHCQLGEFSPIASVPDPYDRLLSHQHHMTVTVEAECGEPVDIHVHRHKQRDHWYAREITLVSRESRRTVQYGIVRLDIHALDPAVWREVEDRQTPLGRVLIEHDVMREVELCGLWQIKAGPSLASFLHLTIAQETFGRTARIHCDGVAAIELLEIVAPVG